MSALRLPKSFLLVLVLAVVLVAGSFLSAPDPALAVDPPPPTSRAPLPPPTPPAPPAAEKVDATTQHVLDEIARSNGVPAGRLSLEYTSKINLPVTGASMTYVKAMDRVSGKGYALGVDQNGKVIDPDAAQRSERAASAAQYGKLHPSLFKYLQGRDAQEKVRVSIWLDLGSRDASIKRIDPDKARSMGLQALHDYKTNERAKGAQVHRQVQAPLVQFLPTVGGRVLSTPDDAPIVLAELPVQGIQQVAQLPYVQTIDLVVQGGPEDDGGGQEKAPPAGPEMATARPASKSNIVAARGFDGTGTKVAVVEGDSIAFANPYIVDSTCGPTAACPSIAEHATAVGGIIGSNHSTSRGTAPGIGTGLLSANGNGWDLVSMQTATNWAYGQGADVLNNSYYLETDGVMHNSDRWLDYVVRHGVVLEVKSAGNRGGVDNNVTSPGLGYNVLTVGAIEDKNTITWTDDTMYPLSSYVQPATREKPEVAAVGCGSDAGNIGITITGIISPWIYDQGCGTSYAAPIVSGAGALLIQRDTALDLWPEAEKAILIATALHNVEGASRISAMDGAGAVDLAAADTVAANGWWRGFGVNPGMFDSNYNYAVMTIHLYAGETMRAALAYDSNPSADYASDALEGDLDLYLLNSTGAVVASSAGVDSWEIIEYLVPTEGDYTVRLENHGGSLSGSESTFAGVAVWPGHYVLQPYAPQSRNRPPGAWNQDSGDDYRYVRGSFWNVIGLRPPSAGDDDLYLFQNSVYGDPAAHSILKSSTYAGSTVDLVLIDGNHAPAGNYYATVSGYTGAGNYAIEAASRSTDVYDGTYGPYSSTSAQVARVWDSHHDAGVREYYGIKPVSGDANLGMALFASDPANSATWYASRSGAVALRDSGGAGANEYMNYQSAAADWLGLVVWSNGATSTTSYYLYRDSTAPTGSIAINGGATYSNSPNVTLNLSGTDPQTGLYQMRFSNDNVSWSGWQAYAASKAWTLTAGLGTKTVYVQYKNNAGMDSPTYSDSITVSNLLYLPIIIR